MHSTWLKVLLPSLEETQETQKAMLERSEEALKAKNKKTKQNQEHGKSVCLNICSECFNKNGHLHSLAL